MNTGLKGGCVLLSVGVNIELNECPVTLLLYYFVTPFENMPFAVNCEICQSGSCVDFGKNTDSKRSCLDGVNVSCN